MPTIKIVGILNLNLFFEYFFTQINRYNLAIVLCTIISYKFYTSLQSRNYVLINSPKFVYQNILNSDLSLPLITQHNWQKNVTSLQSVNHFYFQ